MQESNPTRRKLRIRWIFAALVLLFFVWFCYQLFGPNPAIVVSKETTFITEPLGPDGLPDYEAYLLQQGSKGVTPENNAAVLIWQAMWPGELEQEHWLLMCDALGMDKVPLAKEGLKASNDRNLHEQIALNLAQQYSKNSEGGAEEDYFSEDWQRQLVWMANDAVSDKVTSHPWTSEQLPALAEWAKSRQEQLDLLVEASKRSHYFSPSPSWLNDMRDIWLTQHFNDNTRSAVEVLRLRAMGSLGDGHPDKAWQDLLSCFRLARLTAENDTHNSFFGSIAIDVYACQGTTQLLHHENLNSTTARQIFNDLKNLSTLPSRSHTIDIGERLVHLHWVLTLAARGPSNPSSMETVVSKILDKYRRLRLDWNIVLRSGNQLLDSVVSASNLPTRLEKRKGMKLVGDSCDSAIDSLNNPLSVISSMLSCKARSERLGKMLILLNTPLNPAHFNVEDRANTHLELTRLAAALAVYRAEQGAYPEQLADLVPGVLSKFPVDMYSAKSFLYERKDDGGYLLYSVFENEIDDLGNSMSGEIIEGEWVEEAPDDFDYEETDLVIRVPVPAFEFPELPSKDDLGYGYGGEYGGGYGSDDEDGYGE